ncbi:hypothetical protein CC1G_05812 [Coprinopsis cinerea okayama7|uniref:Uncharacterized protein n=1 Tax=Coprinopsis cinerea (strain Okayama-7 / 130 / ATCC MYA-4618 / FGSC 9003) TaxID=240176 RepID=A8NLF7_COPC7|nr:hypothetical protein CC1G_05812 [Coprinopsis cinerea okayama7\|eukprot:XP_001834675.1 hypothetical protein CC1G_05812 [Coprinopsis cinerea okayama7\
MSSKSRPRPTPIAVSANAPPVPKLSKQAAARVSREVVSKLSLSASTSSSSTSSSQGANVPPLPSLKRKLAPVVNTPAAGSSSRSTVANKKSPNGIDNGMDEAERTSYLQRIRELEQWKEQRLDAKANIKAIERPSGPARRKWDIGEAMGLPKGSDDPLYRSMNRKLLALQIKYEIPRGASLARGAYVQQVADIFTDMRDTFPYLCEERFRDGWPIYDMLQLKLQDQRQYDLQRDRRLAAQRRRRENTRAALAKRKEKKDRKREAKRQASPPSSASSSSDSDDSQLAVPSTPMEDSTVVTPSTSVPETDTTPAREQDKAATNHEGGKDDEGHAFLLSILAQIGPVLGLHFLDMVPDSNINFTYSTWPKYDDDSKEFWEQRDDEIHEQLSDASLTSDPRWWLQVVSERIVDDEDFEAFWPVFYTQFLELDADPRDNSSPDSPGSDVDSPLDLGELSDVPPNPSPKPKKDRKGKGKATDVKVEKLVLPSRQNPARTSKRA